MKLVSNQSKTIHLQGSILSVEMLDFTQKPSSFQGPQLKENMTEEILCSQKSVTLK